MTRLHDFYGLWHLYINFAVLCSVARPFFVASLVFMKGASCCVKRRNFKWNWAVRSCYGKVLQVIGLHDFRCYLHVASWSWHLCNLPCVDALFWLVFIASYACKPPNICFQVLFTCLLAFYVLTPGLAVIRTVLHSSETPCLYSEIAIRLSRDILMFLAAIWSSLCFWSSIYRFIPPLVVPTPQDSNVAVYVVCWVLRVVYVIIRLSSGKTMVSILHQTHRVVCHWHGSKMKNQYSFLEFNKAMWHRLNTARSFECAINFLTKIKADKNRYPIRVHLLTIDRFKNKNKRPRCIKDENGPLNTCSCYVLITIVSKLFLHSSRLCYQNFAILGYVFYKLIFFNSSFHKKTMYSLIVFSVVVH